jgi:uroporphyrinogen-III synthase
MSETVFAIRPQPGLAETIAAGAAVGLTVRGEPLFAVEPVEWDPVDPRSVDAVLLGSANALRCGGDGLAALKNKPVYAVGEKTAEAARTAGFEVAQVGESDLQSLVARLKPPLRLFRPAGEERVALAPRPGIAVEERTVYRAVPLELAPGFAGELAGGGIVLVHSAAAGRHFAAECERLGLARDRLALAALAPRILGSLGAGWAWTAAAPVPTEAALLALVRDMCLTRAGSKNGR